MIFYSDDPGGSDMKNAYFAGGCFWCITPIYAEMDSVQSVVCGFSGGSEIDPSYEDVKYQHTGHRETISVTYDESLVGFSELLDVFMRTVDPFDEDGQLIDRGHSYTLAIYYQDEAERAASEKKLQELERTAGRKVFVALEPFTAFYAAGEEHQDYYLKNPEACQKELETSGRNSR